MSGGFEPIVLIWINPCGIRLTSASDSVSHHVACWVCGGAEE